MIRWLLTLLDLKTFSIIKSLLLLLPSKTSLEKSTTTRLRSSPRVRSFFPCHNHLPHADFLAAMATFSRFATRVLKFSRNLVNLWQNGYHQYSQKNQFVKLPKFFRFFSEYNETFWGWFLDSMKDNANVCLRLKCWIHFSRWTINRYSGGVLSLGFEAWKLIFSSWFWWVIYQNSLSLFWRFHSNEVN